jgi:hypothetical protein
MRAEGCWIDRDMPNWLFAFFMGSALLVGVVAGTFGILHSS